MALKKEWDDLSKGDWFFFKDYTYIAIQYGNDRFLEVAVLPIATIEQHDRARNCWIWDGNKEEPSLTPSILMWGNGKNNPPTWHGYLTKGKIISI